MKATIQQLEACARLTTQEPDFISLLKDRLEEHRTNAVKQREEVPMRWAQGRAQELTDILELVVSASDNLRKAPR